MASGNGSYGNHYTDAIGIILSRLKRKEKRRRSYLVKNKFQQLKYKRYIQDKCDMNASGERLKMQFEDL